MELVLWITMSLISLVSCIFAGIFIGRKQARAKTMGWLRIDRSEPDEPPRLFMELKGVTPDMIAREKFVMFEVINESYISHD